ncbi:MAG: hypothetical protein QM504_08075 [Pseudomonadota bacterium]
MDVNTKLSDNNVVLKFKVGDLVTSEFYSDDSHVVRNITRIDSNVDTGSTVRIWATDGGICDCCNKRRSKSIDGVDGYWFLPENPVQQQ